MPGLRGATGLRLIDGLDPLIHAPTRLQLITMLSAVSEAEFATWRTILEVSDSVLSKHVSALVDAGYLTVARAPTRGGGRRGSD
ncbi:transcriptional regulator [Pseudarthrobacter sulfonivorans]|uniref:transcriptional regulator n=1 Tax=Pseudarthrobacter sulfonivorans TaxID=121292 RepID=UPI003D34E944